MAQPPSKPATVEAILASLPADRRAAIEAVRSAILQNLDPGYREGVQYGMIAYFVPHSTYPAGYHCDPRQPLPYVCLASQKSGMSLHLFCIYNAPDHVRWFREAWTAAGKKLDMGKACVRFKRLEDVPLDVVGEVIRRTPASAHIAAYEAALGARGKVPRGAKAAARAKAPARKRAATKKKTVARGAAKPATPSKPARKKAARR